MYTISSYMQLAPSSAGPVTNLKNEMKWQKLRIQKNVNIYIFIGLICVYNKHAIIYNTVSQKSTAEQR